MPEEVPMKEIVSISLSALTGIAMRRRP